jgi:F0F1-type ATP synthase membrane subunit b/b'
MVDFKLTNAYSPMLFTVNGYQLVVMPMITDKAKEQAKAETEAKAKQAEEKMTPEVKEAIAKQDEAIGEVIDAIAEGEIASEAEVTEAYEQACEGKKPKRQRKVKVTAE